MISREVHISKYYLCRLFREATGTTFLEYLNDIRLSKAHQLLLETNLSIGEIAAKTGFSSGLRLSKVFHSSYHMPPSKFRRHPHEQENNSQVKRLRILTHCQRGCRRRNNENDLSAAAPSGRSNIVNKYCQYAFSMALTRSIQSSRYRAFINE